MSDPSSHSNGLYMFDELGDLATRLEALKPPPPLRVALSEFVPVEEWVTLGQVSYLGRFAWWRLMQTLHEPIPETFMELDSDFPRDCAWTNTRILGACGLTAAILGTIGSAIGAGWPRVGFVITGAANAVMLGANLVLVFRRDS